LPHTSAAAPIAIRTSNTDRDRLDRFSKARTPTPPNFSHSTYSTAFNLADMLRYSMALTLTLRAFSPEWVFYEDSIK
jgi:hypothetical protein